MTVGEARRIIAGPVTFGDAQAIEARDLLRLLDRCNELAASHTPCVHCGGDGFVALNADDHCPDCDCDAPRCDECGGFRVPPCPSDLSGAAELQRAIDLFEGQR